MEEELQVIGDKVGLDASDLKKLKRRKRWERILIPVTGGVITFISFILGHMMGSNADPEMVVKGSESYPYATFALLAAPAMFKRNKLLLVVVGILTVILSYIAFITAYDHARPVYELAIEYGVFRR